MSWDLQVRRRRPIRFDVFALETRHALAEILHIDVDAIPPLVPEFAPGHESPRSPPPWIGDTDTSFLLGLRGRRGSFELVVFSFENGGDDDWFSVDLPTGHSPVGFALVVSAAVVLARFAGGNLLDRVPIYTDQFELAPAEFLDRVAAGPHAAKLALAREALLAAAGGGEVSREGV